jgi:hypothetical protein
MLLKFVKRGHLQGILEGGHAYYIFSALLDEVIGYATLSYAIAPSFTTQPPTAAAVVGSP